MKSITNSQIVTNDALYELKSHGSVAFPFQCYKETWRGFVNVDWHWHEEWELLLMEEGSIECRINEKSVFVRAGEGILIPGFTLHSVQSSKNETDIYCKYTAILFGLNMLAPIESDIYQKTVRPVVDSSANYIFLSPTVPWQTSILKCAEEIRIKCEHPDITSEMLIHIQLCNIWKELMQHIGEFENISENRQDIVMRVRMQKMLQFIWTHYAEPITMDDIAQAANISRSMAQRYFRTCIHDTMIHYLQSYRLNNAKQKLMTTNKKILEIALSSGFENIGYFDRLFKREFGMTPKQFVQQYKQTTEEQISDV